MSSSSVESNDAPRIGPYRTLRELGRGGQAIVWLAEDSRIGRQIALKVLPYLGPGGEDALRRFRREAEVASRLEHPGICAVLEADLDAGTPYIAMRYVPGETLARRLSRAKENGAAPPSGAELLELAQLFEKIARALHVAHEAGIVHRDVKPANLMITPEGEPVVLDFGLAREDDGTNHALSLSGEVSGTPAYMSPEQMTGRSRPDRRTDVWSLGIALFEALTLVHPFAAATREGLFQAIIDEEPPPARTLNAAIDRDLATILETATAKERDRRYQTALDFAEDLRRWTANEPIRARPVGRFERLRRWVQRKPALAASAAAIVVLLLGASALLAYGVGASSRAATEAQLRSVAESARQAADEARVLAERERQRADVARAAVEQVGRDHRFSDELDLLNMQLGTLLFGFNSKESVGALMPKYVAAFRDFGVDFQGERPVAELVGEFNSLRERDGELWNVAQESLRNLAWNATQADDPAQAALRKRVLDVLEAFPGVSWPELDAARERWRKEHVDDFAPLLADDVLSARSSVQLLEIAGALLGVPGHLADSRRIIERVLASDPGSFRLHYLAAAIGFMQAAQNPRDDSEPARAQRRELVHQMEIAVALRPRSGFVRAMFANALAVSGDIDNAVRTMDMATELDPKNALVWLYKARFYSYSPYVQPGIEACDRALALDPTLGGVRELKAQLEAGPRRR